MKKKSFITYGLFISLLMSGCTSDELFSTPQETEFVDVATFDKRTPEDAIRLVNSLSADNPSRSGAKKTIDIGAIKVIGPKNSRSNSNDTLIYAVNYTDSQGFVLVSANKNTEPILAIIDSGAFTDERDTSNECFEMFLNQAQSYVKRKSSGGGLIPTPDPGPDDFHLVSKTDSIKSYYCTEPLLQINWGQNYPANKYCPNNVSGCTPLAVAMVMTYIRPMNEIALTFPERGDKSSTTLNWDEMVKHIDNRFNYNPSSHMVFCNSTEEAHDQIGLLVRQIGMILGSRYKETNQTSTPLANLHNKIHLFFPNNEIFHCENFTLAHSVMSRKHIAILTAGNSMPGGGYSDQHTWIGDGTALVYRMVTTYYNVNTVTGEYDYKEIDELQDDRYIHFNWGHNGLNNGYYLVTVLQPGYGVPYVFNNTTKPTSPNPDYYIKGYQDCIIIEYDK